MEVLTRTNGREMTLAISGELDHHGAHGAMQQIDHALDAAECIISRGVTEAQNRFN